MKEKKNSAFRPIVTILTSGILVILVIAALLPKSPTIQACELHDMPIKNINTPPALPTPLESDALPDTLDATEIMPLLETPTPSVTPHIISYLLLQNMESLIQKEKPFDLPLTFLSAQNLSDTAKKHIEAIKIYAGSGVLTPQSLTEMLQDAQAPQTEKIQQGAEETGFISEIKKFMATHITVEKKAATKIVKTPQITWHTINGIIKEIEDQPKTPELQAWLDSARATMRVRDLFQALEQDVALKEMS